MTDFLIRPYQKGDEFNINKSFNKVFGLNRTIEEWYWKFQPDIEGSRIMVAVDDQNEVLAHYAVTTVFIKIHDKVILGAQSLDSFAINRSDVLKGRLFIKSVFKFINNYCQSGEIPYFYGCNSGKILELGKLLFKYTEGVPITYLYKESFLLLRPLGRVLGGKTWNWYLSRSKDIDKNAVDELWERSQNRYNVTVVRDGDYITKRYITHPAKKYMYLEVSAKEHLCGLAVIIYEERLLKWVDLIWDGEDIETIRSLEAQIWKIAQRAGAIKVELWLNNDEEVKDVLIDCGMNAAPNPYDLYITSRSFDEDLDAEYIANHLYYTMGDSDMV